MPKVIRITRELSSRVLPLPNGHLVLLSHLHQAIQQPAGRNGRQPNVIGDALVDVDQNFNPDWVWNTFDHLDINRRPMNFPDWTHSNGMLYSSDDHNLLLSMRHQNWVIKINFLDGAGSGDIMWHLGEGGDFKLVGATDPTDWFYAQHGMGYFTPNTTGVFRIGLMDNGNDRIFPSGQVICKPGAPANAQCYSTMPLLELNESSMTATMITALRSTAVLLQFLWRQRRTARQRRYRSGFLRGGQGRHRAGARCERARKLCGKAQPRQPTSSTSIACPASIPACSGSNAP